MFDFLIALLITAQLVSPAAELVAGLDIAQDGGSPSRKITDSITPIIAAESAIVLDAESGKMLYGKNQDQARSIASITKLMTAVVFLEVQGVMEKTRTVTEDDKENGGRAEIAPGEIVMVKDLFNAALVGSINNAAYELAWSTDLSYADFIKKMNEKAKEIGMENSFFYEPTGISPRNKATAYETALLLNYALEKKEISAALKKKSYSFESISGQKHYIKNTNELLGSYQAVVGGKTGYTEEAGYCLANSILINNGANMIITVILGAEDKESRFQENKFLAQWAADNWEWQ